MGQPVICGPSPYGPDKTPFVVEIDAKPLAVLFSEALRSLRVYEFMTIARPGDINSYLRVRLVGVGESVALRFQGVKLKWFSSKPAWDEGYLPLNVFDNVFRDELQRFRGHCISMPISWLALSKRGLNWTRKVAVLPM